MRRSWLKLTGLLVAACLAGAANGEGGESETESRTVYQVDVRSEGGRNQTFDRIVVRSDSLRFVAKTRRGIARLNQNRIDYSSIPFLGGLSSHRYDKADFVAARRVGTAYAAGDTLTLALDQPVDIGAIHTVALLNQEFAFETKATIRADDWADAPPSEPPGAAIGEVFLTEGGRLAALIRPFVVTDSALW